MIKIFIHRAYDTESIPNGYRVLVDRVWPRGVSKEELDLDDWMKEIAPSSDLRKWFGHDPERWEEFKERYRKELDDQPDALKKLREIAEEKRLVLLYGARDEEHNQAIVLREVLEA